MIGYVSDERYLALSDVAVEVTVREGQRGEEGAGRSSWSTRSTPSGAVRLDLPPGEYRVTLAKDGYGAKHVHARLGDGEPYHFRMLSDRLFGYMWPKWTVAGARGELRVHSPEAYRVAIRRCGADTGEERLVGWFDEHAPRATVQVTPDDDYTTTGVRWHGCDTLTAPERSGLYYVHAQGESGAHFSFPWVVAPPEPTAPIAVLASTNTWNAYNNFGGRSNYINAAGLPDAPVLVPRLEMPRYLESAFSEHAYPDDAYPPLSFERPEPLNQVGEHERPDDPVRGRQPCHLAAAEWRLLSWMERRGLGYDLYADAQLHDGTLDLDEYKVLVLNTHPEYWSREMYDKVKEWVAERGGRLAYLGGNGVDCEVEFVGETLHFRTEAVAEGGQYESRMHRSHRPTSELLGVVFTSAGAMSATPFRVLDSGHWAFKGAGLADGDEFGAASLHERCPGGASGHETDKRTPRSPAGSQLIAKGAGEGGAEIVHFHTASGGEVFSVGSITWTSSLLVDDAVSTITYNVLSRFGGDG